MFHYWKNNGWAVIPMLAISPFCAWAQPDVASAENTEPSALTVTIIGAHEADSPASLLTGSPGGVGHMISINAEEIQRNLPARVEDVLQSMGLATADAGSFFGLAPSLSMRGFTANKQAAPNLSATKVLLNGHPDIAHGFARDLSTVEQIEQIGNFDATLLGAGSPGGILQYQSKRPHGKDATAISNTTASDGLNRVTLDAERHLGAVQVRAVLASQRGQITPEGQPTDRDSQLLSALLATPVGHFQLDLEQQNNRAPYVFGTFYAAGQFWYDRPYVSPQSRAERQYTRAALYWNTDLGPETVARAWLQQAHVKRDETLVGFWGFNDADATLLDGYYREKQATANQQDVGLQLQHSLQLQRTAHEMTLVLQRQRQSLDFSGPQSIGDYTISIQAPTWPINLSALTLKPRTLQERYTETGIALADRMALGHGVELRLGARRSGIHIDTASNTSAFTPTADLQHTTYATGLAWQPSTQHKLWLSRAESFEPVRGQTRDSSYLPAKTAAQWEAGWQRQAAQYETAVSVFDIRQKNLPGTDPVNKDYLVPVGSILAQGVSLSVQAEKWGLNWNLNTTRQLVRVDTPVKASQGRRVPGVPEYLGGLRISSPYQAQGMGAWLNPFWVGRRPADSHATVSAPGFVRWDTGLSWQQARWQLSATLLNAFDKRYVQALDAPDNVWQGARRSANLGISYRF